MTIALIFRLHTSVKLWSQRTGVCLVWRFGFRGFLQRSGWQALGRRTRTELKYTFEGL
jgi:hypothetical protein